MRSGLSMRILINGTMTQLDVVLIFTSLSDESIGQRLRMSRGGECIDASAWIIDTKVLSIPRFNCFAFDLLV